MIGRQTPFFRSLYASNTAAVHKVQGRWKYAMSMKWAALLPQAHSCCAEQDHSQHQSSHITWLSHQACLASSLLSIALWVTQRQPTQQLPWPSSLLPHAPSSQSPLLPCAQLPPVPTVSKGVLGSKWGRWRPTLCYDSTCQKPEHDADLIRHKNFRCTTKMVKVWCWIFIAISRK